LVLKVIIDTEIVIRAIVKDHARSDIEVAVIVVSIIPPHLLRHNLKITPEMCRYLMARTVNALG
jgi:hypothetical protein